MVGAQRSCVSSRSLCFKVPFGWGSWNATKKPWGWGKQTLRKGELITVYQSPRQHESFGYEILTFRYCELSRETVFFVNIRFCFATNWRIHWRSLRFRRAIYSTPLTTRSHPPNSVSRQLGVLASRRRYVLLGTCPSRLCSCWLGWSSPVFAWLMMVQRRYCRNLLNLCFWGAFFMKYEKEYVDNVNRFSLDQVQLPLARVWHYNIPSFN